MPRKIYNVNQEPKKDKRSKKKETQKQEYINNRDYAYTIRFREYRKRKIEEYKKITGYNSIEPKSDEITIITVYHEVIKVKQKDIEKLKEESQIVNIDSIIGEKQIKAVIVGNGIPYIKNGLFFGQDELKDVIFNEDLEEVKDLAFAHVGLELEEIILPPKLKKIGDSAFRYNGLKKVIFGERLEEIEKYAFSDIHLQEIVLPPKLKKICRGTFEKCTHIKKVTFGEELEEIDSSAFWLCDSLKALRFGEKVKKIGDSAFADCTNLKNVTFGKGLKFIGESAFSRTGLKKVIVPDDILIGSYAFSRCVKVIRKKREEMSQNRISHLEMVKTAGKQLLDKRTIERNRANINKQMQTRKRKIYSLKESEQDR